MYICSIDIFLLISSFHNLCFPLFIVFSSLSFYCFYYLLPFFRNSITFQSYFYCLSVNFPSCFYFPIPDCICLIFSSATFESEYANLIFSQFLTRYSIPLMYIAHDNLIQFYSFF